MKKLVAWALCTLCMVSFSATAQGLLNAYQTVEIKASIWRVWDAVKDFDGLHKWHPMFADDVLRSGANDEIGSVRTITVKDGPSFDEELLYFDALEKQFSYKVIDPAPLPISEYVATFQVIAGRRGYTMIVWRSSFRNNSDGKMKDEEVIGFIDGAFRAGLDNLKSMLESK
jgi:mxaD protein